jgi:hypothetical protein
MVLYHGGLTLLFVGVACAASAWMLSRQMGQLSYEIPERLSLGIAAALGAGILFQVVIMWILGQ